MPLGKKNQLANGYLAHSALKPPSAESPLYYGGPLQSSSIRPRHAAAACAMHRDGIQRDVKLTHKEKAREFSFNVKCIARIL
jgi:hypothetical protein